MWGWNLRNHPLRNYNESSSSSEDSPYESPPGTPVEGLAEYRQASDQLASAQALEGAAQVLAAKMPPKVPYDKENKDDGEDYWKRTGSIKLEWDPDVQFWFNAIEAQLRQAQVFSQWSKREVLMPLLPKEIMEEVKQILEHNPMDEDEDEDDDEEQNWQKALLEGRKDFEGHPFYQQYFFQRKFGDTKSGLPRLQKCPKVERFVWNLVHCPWVGNRVEN